jgi:hypothetical protein
LVSSKNGAAVTQMSPSTAAVQHETERAIHPPEQICRIVDFTDGVPPEYYAFTGSEQHGPEDVRRDKRHIVERIVPISVWRAIVAEEQKLATPTHSPALPFRFVKMPYLVEAIMRRTWPLNTK